jgi:hypothetical protein
LVSSRTAGYSGTQLPKGAQRAKDSIVELMAVPLVQGAIRYSHLVQGEMKSGDVETHDGEAAAFGLAVLPLVHHIKILRMRVSSLRI